MTLPGSPRLGYDQLPGGLRTAIDAALGSPVVRASPRSGGFSPGPAAVVTCADGGRAFLKAAGTPLNPDTPDLLRAEGRVAAAMPASLPVPALRAQVEWADGADSWVALAFAAVDGDSPPLPWTPATATRALAAVSDFARQATPCPVPRLPPLADRVARQLTAWPLLAADPPADLDPWAAGRLDWLAAVGDRVATRGTLAGDTLVHLDLRADNLLLTPGGGTVLVDWPWACRGPAWVDTVVLALDTAVHGGLDPEALVSGLPAVAGADPADVTDLLVVLAGMFCWTTRQPPPPGLPTLRAFQRSFATATLDWLSRRASS